MADPFRAVWDFDDLDGTERRLRERLGSETSDSTRAAVQAEIARVHGLRGEYEAGDALLDDAAALCGGDVSVRARIDLERGRLRRSSGEPDAARPHFESAYAGAVATGQHFLAADAAHMLALVVGDRDGFVEWTQRGIELADAHEDASYWLGPLLNNLGWEHYEAGEFDAALDAFERALRAREGDGSNPQAVEIARYAVGKTLRALGRSDEAIPLLQQAVAWAEAADAPDGWFHEELAEEYAAVGRLDDARVQASFAITLLERDDSSFGERRTRLESIASG